VGALAAGAAVAGLRSSPHHLLLFPNSCAHLHLDQALSLHRHLDQTLSLHVHLDQALSLHRHHSLSLPLLEVYAKVCRCGHVDPVVGEFECWEWDEFEWCEWLECLECRGMCRQPMLHKSL